MTIVGRLARRGAPRRRRARRPRRRACAPNGSGTAQRRVERAAHLTPPEEDAPARERRPSERGLVIRVRAAVGTDRTREAVTAEQGLGLGEARGRAAVDRLLDQRCSVSAEVNAVMSGLLQSDVEEAATLRRPARSSQRLPPR